MCQLKKMLAYLAASSLAVFCIVSCISIHPQIELCVQRFQVAMVVVFFLAVLLLALMLFADCCWGEKKMRLGTNINLETVIKRLAIAACFAIGVVLIVVLLFVFG